MRALLFAVVMCGSIVCGAVFGGGGRVAHAADEPLDTIVMTDGAMVRGRVVEMVPQQRVVVQIATGETRTIDWALIARIEGPSVAPVGAPPPASPMVPVAPVVVMPPPPVVVAAEPLLTPAPGRVPLHVESARQPVRIGEPLGVATSIVGRSMVSVAFGRTVCSTPCTLHVPPGVMGLWVTGEGQRSQTISVNVPPDGTAVRVRPSSAWGWLGGFLLTGAGVGAIASGGLLLSLGLDDYEWENGRRVARPDQGNVISGSVLTALGVPLLVGGIVLIYKNRGGIESQRSYAERAQASR